MSDRISRAISKYATSIRFEDLSPEVVREVKLRILDSIGCALGSLNAQPVKIARRMVYELGAGPKGSTIWGSTMRVTPDWATFVNGLMVRYLDFNDTYLSKEPLHPSDMIPALIALGEFYRLRGKDLVSAVAVAYEVAMRLCDAASLRLKGWDHVNYTMIGSVAGAANLLKLDESKASNALAISAVPHGAMRQTRVGELSMWKGAAAANACRNGVYAALLASYGFTGPDKPFEGEMGFIRQLPGVFDYAPMEALEKLERPKGILDSYMKFYPVEYHAQSAVQAAHQLLREGLLAEDVEEITIETFQAAYDIIVKDPEKWDPKTRETADHSLPYCVATTLARGDVWIDSFEPEELRNPLTRRLLERIKVVLSEELTKKYPEAIANRLTIRLRDGRVLKAQVDYPVGHPKSPPSEEMVRRKFERLARGLMSREQMGDVVSIVMRLEELDDISRLVDILAV